jgi:hypothetical protein
LLDWDLPIGEAERRLKGCLNDEVALWFLFDCDSVSWSRSGS